MNEYKHLKRWTMPQCYAGEVWPNWYVFLSQHRDSDALTRSNFMEGLSRLGGESETVRVIRERHWAVGWIEWIGIDADDEKACAMADEMLEEIDQYPALNEDAWSDLEYSEACDFWAGMSVQERMYYCEKAQISKFAARRDYLPKDPYGTLLEYLRGV